MKLRSTCPQCESVFRLTTDQLDAAQGWVQCGVCGAAFDARPTLAQEDGSPLPEPAVPEPPPTPEPAEAIAEAPGEFSVAQEEAAAVEAEAGIAATAEAGSPVAATPEEELKTAPVAVGIARREAADELPSIILIDPDAAAAAVELGPLPQIPVAPERAATPAPALPKSDQPAAPAPTPGTRIEYATAMPSPGARIPAGARRRLKPWAWASLSAVLALILLAQAAWFLRDTMVSQAPQLRPLFERVCDRLGCSLGLPKNEALLQIIGSDLQTEASGRLTLVLTLGNRANHAQAWPMLVLTLTDARGQPLTRRSFAPSEYLADPQRIAAGLPPLSEQPLSLPLTVSGIRPMGFDLKLAY